MKTNQLTNQHIDDLEWEYLNMYNFFSKSKTNNYVIDITYNNSKKKIKEKCSKLKMTLYKNKHCENQQIVRDTFKNKLNYIKKKIKLKQTTRLEDVYLNIIIIFSEYKIDDIKDELNEYLKNNNNKNNRYSILRLKYYFYKCKIIKCLKLKKNTSTNNLYNEIIKRL